MEIPGPNGVCVIEEMWTCWRCKEQKPPSQFYPSQTRNKRGRCKVCFRNYYKTPEALRKIRAQNRKWYSSPENKRRAVKQCQEWRKKNPERHQDTYLSYWRMPETIRRVVNYRFLKAYRITLDQYEELLLRQDGKCAICGTDKPTKNGKTKRLAVDHCHTTGRIRGLLCNRCNLAIGLLKDDLALVEKVRQYLE